MKEKIITNNGHQFIKVKYDKITLGIIEKNILPFGETQSKVILLNLREVDELRDILGEFIIESVKVI